jgi:hypothetical protein
VKNATPKHIDTENRGTFAKPNEHLTHRSVRLLFACVNAGIERRTGFSAPSGTLLEEGLNPAEVGWDFSTIASVNASSRAVRDVPTSGVGREGVTAFLLDFTALRRALFAMAII